MRLLNIKWLRNKLRSLCLLLVLVFISAGVYGQDTIKFETIKSIKDIPHATLKQKWMWIHRSIAFLGTMGMFDSYVFDDTNRAIFNYAYGKVRVFAGYRFSIEKQQKRFLQKLNLIDYRL